MHVNWLNTYDKPNKMVENIILSYDTILKDMREVLINSMIKCDVSLLILAILCLCHVSRIIIKTVVVLRDGNLLGSKKISHLWT